MLFKFFTLVVVCSYFILINKHYLLPLFFLLIIQNLCFSYFDLFQSQISDTSKLVYHTTLPTRGKIKCEVPYFFQKQNFRSTYIHASLMQSASERQGHNVSCLLLYIKTDWVLSYLRSVQCRLLNDRLPQRLSSSIFSFSLFASLCAIPQLLNEVPTNNKPDHISYHSPSLYSRHTGLLFQLSFPHRDELDLKNYLYMQTPHPLSFKL